MDHFLYKDGALHAEDVPVTTLADSVGTPFYCYSTATLTRHYRVFAEGLSALSPLICFAVKANSNPHVLQVLGSLGAGADVVSEGEIRLARAAGIPAERIVFSGVGKTRSEMRYGLEQGIFQFNVESEAELRILSQEAAALGKEAPVALRVNPDVDAGTHEKITTGRKDSKFGVDIRLAPELYALAASLPGIAVRGISVHIGSQLTSLPPFLEAFSRVRQFVERMRGEGYELPVIDLGGGLGIPYDPHSAEPPPPQEYGAFIAQAMDGLEAQYVFEPGRLIAGNAGILVSRVIYGKENDGARFLIIDAGMNDLLRPAMYDAQHTLIPVDEAINAPRQPYHVVGPVCESSDVFGRGVMLPELGEGALLALRSAGAYGAVMSSTYNARPPVPEILVDGDTYRVIRPRPDYEAMLAAYAPLT